MLPSVQQVRWSLCTNDDSSHMVRKAKEESLEAVPKVQAASRSAPLSASGTVVLWACICEGLDFTTRVSDPVATSDLRKLIQPSCMHSIHHKRIRNSCSHTGMAQFFGEMCIPSTCASAIV
jgi:hypothetical protein